MTASTLTFTRDVAAPVATLWQAWLAPAARAVWSAPSPDVTVEILHSDPQTGGREVSLCKQAGQPDIRCEAGWLDLLPETRSVGYEIVSTDGTAQSAALITARFTAQGESSRIEVTVQLSPLATDMEAGYRTGFAAAIDNLTAVAERTLLIRRKIKAPRSAVWCAWLDPESLPKWWGPDGFSCRTTRIDLRAGGEWVFDMIAPDGTVFPNHHRYHDITPETRLSYSLLWGENGPKHADAWASFDEDPTGTIVTLCMIMSSSGEFRNAKAFGAEALGLQTLGKLASAAGERA